jgi:hypothetical protein
MRTYKKTTRTIDEFVSIKCDVCGREDDDVMETQEYLCIHFIGGYNSIFEDSGEYECDVCQHCVGELLGKHLRYLGSRI